MLFFGTEEFSAAILQGLLDNGFSVDAVITKPDSASGRGQKIIAPAVKTIAIENNITVLQPARLIDSVESIKSLNASAAVLASYGNIIPQAVLDLFDIINVHPSLLPKYRGASPIESAILHGDIETGVSIMKLVAAMDAGPVYAQSTVALSGDEYVEELYERLANEGVALLKQHLPAILDGSLKPTPQTGEPVYCSKISKGNGLIDTHKTAVELERQIRAYHRWPQSRTSINDIEVIITKAHVEESSISHDPWKIPTSEGFLAVDALKPVGKKEMPIQAFLAGYHSQL